ncbi:putative antibiotic modification-related protein [Halobacteriovorax sp. BALOs_7]|uniref:lanthionine synthetase C family protein n=1 Tax=Halobacteriovorax sp. BALOs_7 TaxID=2109558 RepID=UPI000EA174C8|nr:LanC-like protein [Halobacteriovorax sp. BALOs_7]AYF44405.1 putative antibiotic modification-related protein [Halobacteriovorax sp. BALOs_7]
MTSNYDKDRHEEINQIDWDKTQTKEVVKTIFREAVENLNVNSDKQGLYEGSAGVLWGILNIKEYLSESVDLDPIKAANDIYESYLKNPDTNKVVPSLPMGQVGLLLLRYRINPSKDLEDEVYSLVKSNIENPTLEFLWGAPGTMLAASYFYDQTSQECWADLYRENARYLIKKLQETSEEALIWMQDMYGKEVPYVGAGHGYFGNMYGILKRIDLLSTDEKSYITHHIKKTALKLSRQDEDGHINWRPTYPDIEKAPTLVQWCHGSPGIITSLKKYPDDTEINELLVNAGELVWKAGPLKKGVCICHGTDGNGFAFLQLYKRTGDAKWLSRARAFAMHEINKEEYKNSSLSLFTGKIGFALFLIGCLEERDNFPLLDEL